MALIVEDGTGVVNANSYISVDNFQAYAELYGKTIDAAPAEIALRKAMDYIELQKYKGTKEFDTNTLKFPRTGIVIDGETLTDIQSLSMIVRVQSELAMSINDGVDPLAIQGGKVVSSETYGPMTTAYATNKETKQTNPRVDLFLNPLLLNEANIFHFKVITDKERHNGCK